MHKLDLLEDQFDRQKKIVWWEQERLLNSKVLLVGAGALGNEIAKNLTLVGVGQITIVDNDLVDLTNISISQLAIIIVSPSKNSTFF